MESSNALTRIYENVESILKSNNIETSDFKTISYGIQFKVFILNWSGVIRIYQNKKGIVRYDFSQLKNDEYSLTIKELIGGGEKTNKTEKQLKSHSHEYPVIGTDESGKGDYFGPLVSAGVYVDSNSAQILHACGIKDSKNLSDSKNIELAKQIKEICKGQFVVIEISPEKYNDLYEQFTKEKKNLNTLLAWGHAKAIEELLSKVECKTAIADQFADEKFIINKLQEKGKKLNLIQMHKAESNIAVAAASILARARFLNKLSILSRDYKMTFPKGASNKVVECAKKFAELHGIDSLKQVAKLHFKTTKQVLSN